MEYPYGENREAEAVGREVAGNNTQVVPFDGWPEDVEPVDELPEGVELVVLRKPVKFDGEEITELVFDFDSLTARDLLRSEREAKLRLKKKERLDIPKEMDSKYTICVAAKAAGVKAELLFALGAQDFTNVHMQTMNFLLDGASEETEENSEQD